jgi:hypothetical protein
MYPPTMVSTLARVYLVKSLQSFIINSEETTGPSIFTVTGMFKRLRYVMFSMNQKNIEEGAVYQFEPEFPELVFYIPAFHPLSLSIKKKKSNLETNLISEHMLFGGLVWKVWSALSTSSNSTLEENRMFRPRPCRTLAEDIEVKGLNIYHSIGTWNRFNRQATQNVKSVEIPKVRQTQLRAR